MREIGMLRIEVPAMREKICAMIADWADETDEMIRQSIDAYIESGQLKQDIDFAVREEIPKLIKGAMQHWEVQEAIRKLILADLSVEKETEK